MVRILCKHTSPSLNNAEGPETNSSWKCFEAYRTVNRLPYWTIQCWRYCLPLSWYQSKIGMRKRCTYMLKMNFKPQWKIYIFDVFPFFHRDPNGYHKIKDDIIIIIVSKLWWRSLGKTYRWQPFPFNPWSVGIIPALNFIVLKAPLTENASKLQTSTDWSTLFS